MVPPVEEVEQLPLLQATALEHPPVPLASFPVQLLPLQYIPEPHRLDCAVPQAPDPLQVEISIDDESEEHGDGHEISEPG